MDQRIARPFTLLHGMNNDAAVWAPVVAALGDEVVAATSVPVRVDVTRRP